MYLTTTDSLLFNINGKNSEIIIIKTFITGNIQQLVNFGR